MFGAIINSIADIALDYCAAKSLYLNSQEKPQNREEWEQMKSDRKFVSNVRNVAYIAKRIAR